MGSTRKAFTQEYKDNAVELVIREGRRIVDVANGIGITPGTLGNWVKKAKEKDNYQEPPLDKDEREELRQLRQENRELKMQLDFAKKVATWFAKEKQ
jgi:transposase